MAKKLPDAEPETFEVGRAAHVGIVDPSEGLEPRVRVTWEEFVAMMTTFTVSESKVGEYVCRPMGGDGHRTDANALPWPLCPLDLDELQPSDLDELTEWCKDFGGDVIIATTFSHTAEAPRVRLWLRCDRAVTATEHLFLFKAMAQRMPYKLDVATAKPSQPIYLPRCPEERKDIAFAKYYPGKPLLVDTALNTFRAQITEREQRNQGARFAGKGVRQPGGVIEAFNEHFDLPALLEAHGYKRKTRSRYISPASKSGRAAVTVHDWGLISFHDPDHDPLSKRDELNVPRVLDPFAVYTILEHDDDFIPAFRATAKMVKSHGWQVDGDLPVSDHHQSYRILDVSTSTSQLRARDMVIEGVLEREAITIATGQSNSGKTTVLQYMALCIAAGLKFASHEVKQGRVLWIAGEDQHNARLRFASMCDEYGIAFSSIDSNLRILPQAVAVMDRPSMEAFHAAVARDVGEDTDFCAVFIDSKSMNWGGEDENSNDENAQFIKDTLEHFVVKYRAAVIITHHLTKNKEKEEQTSRGASALINNCDHEWRFEMRPATMMSIMEPGSKLRIARWEPIRFHVKTVTLSEMKYPHLKNNLGHMPQISIPEPSNQFGVSIKKLSEDQEFADILAAIRAIPPQSAADKKAAAAKGKKGKPVTYPSATDIAKQLGKLEEGSSKADSISVRDWMRRKLEKLVAQKLIKADHSLTEAGDAFIETVRMGTNLAEPQAEEEPDPDSDSPDSPRTREPGEDDE